METHQFPQVRRIRAGFTVALLATLFTACSSAIGDHDATVDARTETSATEDGGCVPARQASSCFVGWAFAQCGEAETQPSFYCSTERCVWISDGCPAAPFTAAADVSSCECQGSCPAGTAIERFVMERGTKPWDRTSLRLPVTVKPELQPTTVSVTCSGCATACAAGDNPCTGAPPLTTWWLHAQDTETVAVWTSGGMGGWTLEIEFDSRRLAQRTARICRIPGSDAISCSPLEQQILCAEQGEVTVGESSGAGNVGVEFNAVFGDGVGITGRL